VNIWARQRAARGRQVAIIALETVLVVGSTKAREEPTLDHLARYLNILLSSHENKNIAGGKREMNLEDLFNGAVDVVLAGRLRVECFHRESAPGDSVCWGVSIEHRELLSAKRSTWIVHRE
jgi:hypothetical protein